MADDLSLSGLDINKLDEPKISQPDVIEDGKYSQEFVLGLIKQKNDAEQRAKDAEHNSRMKDLKHADEKYWESFNYKSRKWTKEDSQQEKSSGSVLTSGTRSRSVRPEPGCSIISDLNEVMADFDQLRDSNLYDAVYAKVKANVYDKTERPKIGDDENTTVHSFLKAILKTIEETLGTSNQKVNKCFHEYRARSTTGKRPDWVFTLPNEQAHSFVNSLFYFEAKAVGTKAKKKEETEEKKNEKEKKKKQKEEKKEAMEAKKAQKAKKGKKGKQEQHNATAASPQERSTAINADEKETAINADEKETAINADEKETAINADEKETAISAEKKLAEGLFQCIRRVSERHEKTNRKTTHGFGIVSNGNQLQILRVNFNDHPKYGLFPVFATNILPLFNAVKAEGELENDVSLSREVEEAEAKTCPEGLRYLIDFMVNHSPHQFGLPSPPLSEVVRETHTFNGLLGTGGFGNVWQVLDNANGAQFACKCIRNPSNASYLQDEAVCLTMLQSCVPRVPRLVKTIQDPSGSDNVVALIMSPVGVSLKEWVARHPEYDLAAFAAHVFSELFQTITKVHENGCFHEDIRPSNVIISSGSDQSESPEVVLIDWGLAAPRDAKLSHNFGELEYMSDDRLYRWLTSKSATPPWNPDPCHDLQALMLTYFSIRNNFKPFPIDVSKKPKCIIAERRALIDAALKSVTNEDIRSKLEVCFNSQPTTPPEPSI